MVERRLLLHAGMPKTGTSALQAAFARNERLLEAAGVHHPEGGAHRRALRGKVTAGNAGPLTPWLRGGDEPSRDEVATWLDDLLGQTPAGADRVLISSETCFYAVVERATALRELLAERGCGLEALVLVRDAVPWTVSTYGQHVQRLGHAGSLAQWVEQFRHVYADWRTRLTTLREVLGPESLTVLHYDSHRADLVGHVFAEVLGVPTATPPRQDAPVNRTLGAREVAWMREVNASIDDVDRARGVGNVLLKGEPLVGDVPLRAGRAEAARIAELAEPHVAWVNDTFFHGGPVLGTGLDAAADADVDTAASVTLGDDERAALGLAVHLAERLPRGSGVDAEVAELRGRLQEERRRRRAAERRLRRVEVEDPDTSTPDEPSPGRWRAALRRRR
ncbi:hypothetical protein [Nocardioides nanhaiensis]|uniref:Sulfotransferase family protein n=1 Tax=Nocardioides nanhaiensis TaxID=1476871 RepID=A0ABP8W8L6_9ACTN